MRVSDADRDAAAEQLREHFAQGRLAPDEFDERISAALGAKTAGDLRRVMADLPGPAMAQRDAGGRAPSRPWPGPRAYRGPRLLPLVLIVLIAAVAIPGAGWALFAFLKIAFVLWLVACLAGFAGILGLRRRARYRWRHEHWPHEHRPHEHRPHEHRPHEDWRAGL